MSESPRARRPDILVLVVDCGRASDFPAGSDPTPGLRNMEALARESVVFPRAIATAPWTVPSHASLFTGLYPWESGVHARGTLQLDPTMPNLAGTLAAQGYRTLSLAANGFLGPEFGLTSGFQSAAWGEWWERYVRIPERPSPPNASGAIAPSPGPAWLRRRSAAELASYLHRFPVVLDGTNRLARRLRAPGPDGPPDLIAPWVESVYGRWLERCPRDTPTFTFVNLMDVHEPYLSDAATRPGISEWVRAVRTRHDRYSLLIGAWRPTPAEFAALRALYRDGLRRIDYRLGRLIDCLRKAGRWDDAVIVFTSDHGQAFGEHGRLFHGYSVDDPILRIPLWLRSPNAAAAGQRARGWASLIDVPNSLLSAAGSARLSSPSSVGLHDLVDDERPSPALAVCDGLSPTNPLRRRGTPEQKAEIGRLIVAAYERDTKLALEPETDRSRAYDLRSDPAEARDVYSADNPVLASLREDCERVGAQMIARPASIDPTVSERLRAWGY